MAVMLLALAVAFGALAWVGIALTRDEGRIAAVWFSNALLVVAMLRLDRRWMLPGMGLAFVTNILANLAWHDPPLQALGLAMANQLEVLLVLWALHRMRCAPPDFCNNRHTITFAVIALLAAACSGLVAVLILAPQGLDASVSLWWSWARADALGLALLVPALSLIIDGWKERHRLTRRKLAEALGIIAFGSAVSIYTFWQTDYPFLFLDAPVVLLYAIRLGPVGNAIAIINLAIIASVATTLGHGPINLMNGGLGEKLMVLQVFLASSFAIGLPIAALLRRERQMVADKAMFLASISHDIRTPMNGVIGFAELLRHGELKLEQQQLVDRISESGETMVCLLEDLLDYSKMEAGRLELEDGEVDLRKDLTFAAGLFEPLARAKGITIESDLDPHLPALVRGDSVRLRQVLINLVSNAVKFTDKGSVTLCARIQRGVMASQLLIEVRDTGIGIPASAIERIFGKYEQVDKQAVRGRGGAGLGLAISHQLVRLMDGSITVQSDPGSGTTFLVTLPLREIRQPQLDAEVPLSAAA
ncbi:ATP-binding protein [Alteraurantiacibacter aquimixticola]|uniref:histidine kinase n=1 Tax=Alteraurantiacibacter aquimixticola TaxID=2489173 RepID=A0A4T3EYR5_9SPHN|nr:ATP-binding protein [Alteraurantiacibacter aquimixticola]TIX49786.1 hypothetical protein E5222_13330 [Alteraurantiacibacter aquimixticola]